MLLKAQIFRILPYPAMVYSVALIWVLAIVVRAFETVQDAAIIARNLVDLSPNSIGTMATVYPLDHPTLAGQPFGLQEYYASCFGNGSLTLLVLPISLHSQNILHSPTHSASLTISSRHPAASHARVSLIGNVTVFQDWDNVPEEETIKDCYLAQHPDANRWLPNDEEAAHIAYWARFDPKTIYFVGGFGGEHYIGYIPLEIYRNASAERGGAGRVLVKQQL